MAIEYKLVNATFKSLGRMQETLDREAADGWAVHAAGPFYVFLGREQGVQVSHQVARVLFRDIYWSIRLAEEHAREGWRLAALSPSLAFFTRSNGEAAPPDLRYHARGISLLTPGGIRSLLAKEGHDGWRVRAMTAGSALLEKPTSGANPIEHLMDGVLLRTVGMTERLLAERAQEGWRLTCASRLFLAFAREKPE